MKRKTLYDVGLCLLATAVLFAAQSARAADKVSADRLLPPDVKVFVSISNVEEVKQRWPQTLFGQLQRDEDVAEFRKAVELQLSKLSAEWEKQIGVKMKDMLGVPSGELTFGLWQTAGKSLSAVVLLDFGESEATMEKLLERADKALSEQQAERKVDEFEETRITTYTVPSDEDEDDKDGHSFSYFLKDSFVVFGTDISALETVLARWDGKHSQTFADNKTYRYIIERCKSEQGQPLFRWYVDPIGLAQNAIVAQKNPQLQMMFGMLPILGINQLQAIGGSIDIATGQYDSISRMVVYADAPRHGVLNVFQFPAVQQKPPQWVSAATSTYLAVNWDVAGAYAAIETLFDSFRGPGALAKLMDGVANSETGPKLHPKKDLIDLLSGRIHILFDGENSQGKNDDAEADELPQQRMLVALGLKDSDKMKAVLEKIAGIPGFPGKSRQFRGETLYELPLVLLAGAGSGTMGLGVAREHLMIASQVTLLEDVIRAGKDQKSLAETAEYRRNAGQFPAKTSILGFQKQGTQAKAGYELLRSGGLGVLIPGIDFTKLPPFGTVQKYLRASGSYFVPDEHGAYAVSFTLRDKD